MSPGWGKEYILSPLLNEKMWRHALMGIELESRQVNYRDDLPKLDCPTLIMRGENEGSLLSDDDVKFYVEGLSDARLEVFNDAGHDIQKDQFYRFVKVINNFLKEVDKK